MFSMLLQVCHGMNIMKHEMS